MPVLSGQISLFTLVAFAGLSLADATGNGHVHSSSLGDPSGGFGSFGGSYSGTGQMPPSMNFGGGMPPAPAPVPPPPPPKLSAPNVVKGDLSGPSRTDLVGKPGTAEGVVSGSPDRPIRDIAQIYGEAPEANANEVTRVGRRSNPSFLKE